MAQFTRRSDFLEAIADREDSDVDRMRDQIWVLSHAVDRKYERTRLAMLLASGGLLASLAAVGIDAMWL